MKNKKNSWLRNIVETLCRKLEKSILKDKALKCKVVYGPVRSRRLGLVLGINNVKPGICSYNCIYCQSGKTSCCSICTNNCLSPYELFVSVKNKIEEIKKMGKNIDYILFAGSGDPAIDTSLSQEIQLLREFDYKIAVFTNSALLWNENIQENLMYADYVSLKIDTANEETWLKINRPHERLKYDLILKGIEQFSKKFRGTLTTETMLIKNFNDNENEIKQLGNFLNTLKRNASYFMTPIYPPAEKYAVSPDEDTLKKLSEIIKTNVPNSMMLCCPDKEEFFTTDDFENELLGLLELHPVNEEAVTTFAKANDKIDILQGLLANKLIEKSIFANKKYYKLAETK
ncbi:Fe-S oxidoreductase [Ignavibacterium album JCM 16511]|uniref:Fe-S oxidoreductase n=1 Tax=Ignavibacterium album (strain DSM 19864 / JCM 16511 / NBRC 101810 / Mat9-16) TaxID=945713 RepID=I0AIL1_IGNAJ|nr:radical SAM protein [Ignavibacterium album]AFH48818.1 Fe-S oxidoreductase [Ignavibacterium album JCM 16511]